MSSTRRRARTCFRSAPYCTKWQRDGWPFPARCLPYSGLAAHRPFSPDLGAVARGAGLAADAAASAQAGSLSYLSEESDARAGDGAGPLPEEEVVGQGGPPGTGKPGSRSLEQPPTDRPAAAARPSTLSQDFIRSKAWRRNSLLYRCPFFRSTLRLLSDPKPKNETV